MADSTSTLTYPSSLLSQDLPASLQFTIFERHSAKNAEPKTLINLYMPEELSSPSSVKWGDEALGIMGGIVQGNTTAAVATGTARWMADNVGAAGAKAAGIRYDAAKVGSAVSAATGKIMNPYLTAVLQGVDFRGFSFKFKFSPHSEKDCEKIDEIVRTFRAAALPASSMGGGTMDYPHEFELKYMFGGEPHKWLKKFKRSVLTVVDVTYGIGDQWSQFRNGFPTMIVLNMVFKEIELVLRDDVYKKDGY